jgi:hypothetical protein
MAMEGKEGEKAGFRCEGAGKESTPVMHSIEYLDNIVE